VTPRQWLVEVVVPLLAMVAIIAGFALVPTSRSGPGDENTLERLKRTGGAVVGYANEAPYAYVDPATGAITGEAVEIARVVLGRLGVTTVDGMHSEFASLIPGLDAGRCDLVAAGMYITPQRAERVRFSRPTYVMADALLVRTGNPLGLHGFDDVVARTATLGVMAGAAEHAHALACGVPAASISLFPDQPAALAALRSQRIDALACTTLTARHLLRAAGGTGFALATPFRDPVVDDRPARGYGAFAFRNRDADLQAAFDAELERFIGSPEHLALVEGFGFGSEHLPDRRTVAEVLAP